VATTGDKPELAPNDGLVEALEAAQARIEQLETALRTRIVLEQAKGVLRERFGWTLDEAFEILRSAARSSRRRIHDVAEQVVASSDTPPVIAIALARSSRLRAAYLRERTEAQREHAARLIAQARAFQEAAERRQAERRRRAQP